MSDKKTDQHLDANRKDEGVKRERRVRVLKKGKIVFQKGLRSIPCLVRDFSERGAQLEFEQPYMLPTEFKLQVDLGDFEVSCRRCWVEGLRCGVEFVGEKRRIAQMRSQTLKTSEEALKEEEDEFVDNTSNFFKRRQNDTTRHPAKPERSEKRPSGNRGGKPAFGKRQ